MTMAFQLDGQDFVALNGGPYSKQTGHAMTSNGNNRT